MTPEQRSEILALVLVPGGRKPAPADEFLRKFGVTDGARLGLDLLRDAVARRDPIDVVEFAEINATAAGEG